MGAVFSGNPEAKSHIGPSLARRPTKSNFSYRHRYKQEQRNCGSSLGEHRKFCLSLPFPSAERSFDFSK